MPRDYEIERAECLVLEAVLDQRVPLAIRPRMIDPFRHGGRGGSQRQGRKVGVPCCPRDCGYIKKHDIFLNTRHSVVACNPIIGLRVVRGRQQGSTIGEHRASVGCKASDRLRARVLDLGRFKGRHDHPLGEHDVLSEVEQAERIRKCNCIVRRCGGNYVEPVQAGIVKQQSHVSRA